MSRVRCPDVVALHHDHETLAVAPDAVHLRLTRVDAIAGDLLTTEPPQIRGNDAVAREERVEAVRGGVAVLTGVAQEDAAAAPPEDERGAEPRGAAADDDRVVHGPVPTQARCQRIGLSMRHCA